MTSIDKNIIIGSLIGDGTLSIYVRSKNACYRENTGMTQRGYRKWKTEILEHLDFKVYKNGSMSSPSHPIYTELYSIFYKNNKKVLTKEGLQFLNHPIGLACLFMDDESLVINNYKKGNTITITPQIALYTQNFTKNENILLKNIYLILLI